MEKFKEIYFYIQTEAYKANVNERADPVIVQRFYEETREMFWDLGFTLGRDYALKENSCLQIGVMTFRGNLKKALIPEVEQALKTAETFHYSHYNDYGDTFLLSETEQETYFQDHLADYEKEVLNWLDMRTGEYAVDGVVSGLRRRRRTKTARKARNEPLTCVGGKGYHVQRNVECYTERLKRFPRNYRDET